MGRDYNDYIDVITDYLFQSTRPHGARPVFRRMPRVQAGVSIHAPTWGATGLSGGGTIVTKFQSTRPHGARLALFGICFNNFMFQSTRPHGARPVLYSRFRFRRSFNPRAHMGRDIAAIIIQPHVKKFQSTRPHGARLDTMPRTLPPFEFQSTRPHGARQGTGTLEYFVDEFQSTRPHGARPWQPYLL